MNIKLRKKSRETVYQLIYELLFIGLEPNEFTLNKLIEDNNLKEERDYILTVYNGVIEKYDEIIELIAKYAIGFKVDRIYKTDLAALLLAIYEMKYMDSIPLSVSISEAVELVKIYSTEKSSSYVNGVLSSVFKDISNE